MHSGMVVLPKLSSDGELCQMTNDDLLSKTISFLRFPLTVGIVFIHFNLNEGLTIHGIKYGLDNPGWYFHIINFINEVLARIAVPLFFVISGFLYFRKGYSLELYKEKLKSRTRSLFIPYVIWNCIAIIWIMKCFLPIISSYTSPLEIHLSISRIFNTFFFCSENSGIFVNSQVLEPSSVSVPPPIDVPLWYVRDLMVMVLLSPLTCWIIRKFGCFFSLGLGSVWFLSPLFPKDSYIGHLVTPFLFYSIGAYFSKNENIVVLIQKLKHVPILYIPIAITDTLTKGMDFNDYFHKLGILIGVISAIVVASYIIRLGKGKVLISLAKSSFFIFALHYIFIGDIGKFIFIILHVPDNNPYAMLTLYFIVPIFSILLCLGFYLFLRRFAPPKVFNLLTGGR